MTTTNTIGIGDTVKVIRSAHAPKERGDVVGKVGVFDGYTGKGYAKVIVGSVTWFLHPENLVVQHRVTCAVKDCGFYANDMSDYCPSHG